MNGTSADTRRLWEPWYFHGGDSPLGSHCQTGPLEDNPHHWLLVLPEGASNSGIQNPLKTFAVSRGWLYAPPGTPPLQ